MAPQIDRILADTKAGIEQAVEDSRQMVAKAVRGSAAAIADCHERRELAIRNAQGLLVQDEDIEDRLGSRFPDHGDDDREEWEDYEGWV